MARRRRKAAVALAAAAVVTRLGLGASFAAAAPRPQAAAPGVLLTGSFSAPRASSGSPPRTATRRHAKKSLAENDTIRNVMFISVMGGIIGASYALTGKWWKLPMCFALPSMFYRLWTSGGNTEKLAQVSASVDSKYVASSEEEKKELHMFMCSGCGYTLFPARGRDGFFFPDSFKCPMCQATKDEFVDMNDDEDDGSRAAAAAAALGKTPAYGSPPPAAPPAPTAPATDGT
eukprot:CAMPEP_0115082758 /NCGR_PEP_ID=MMETSP0227-20121206/20105_1 /TAXON_ID=89957 /ORGANISM="Polarella glacialis, Strain CCMP 1383" /LENGTH=231 /DNA_ID=CAMNT_0002470935 /DNA_START=88 /DNA_END=783 /DNA_ORIENTATION=-